MSEVDCGCGNGRICQKHAAEAWEKRAGSGIGHHRRTAKQPPREVREKARRERQASRIKADRDLANKNKA